MGCSSCRKPPRIVRKPSGTTSSTSQSIKTTGNTVGSGDQRSRITGLTYVPKR